MAPKNRNDDGGGVLGAVARFWTGSYAPDYVGFAVLLAGYILILLFIEPFHRMFAINDLRIAFPHAEVERVPVFMNIVYALFIPLGFLVAFNTLFRSPVHKHHVTILGFAIALVLTLTLTDLVKNTVGRPRPDLVARCKPAPGTPADKLVTWEVCTETEHHRLHDGWRSFPSGHSSFSFAGLGYVSLFLAGQLRVFVAPHIAPDGEGSGVGSGTTERVVHVRGDLGRALFCFTPLVGALMIAISRCQDYRHDVYDVCAGSLLGFVVAYWSYRRYWPRLSSSRCDEPYPSPGAANGASRAGGGRYGRLRDVEEGGGQNVGYELSTLNR